MNTETFIQKRDELISKIKELDLYKEYKKLDNLCKDLLGSNQGITQYVNEMEQKVHIINYTDNLMFRAFGKVENPDYKMYEEFLESRCFPANRDKMKLILKDLGLPFYDPIMIIEKTEGRMAEDDFWIRIER